MKRETEKRSELCLRGASLQGCFGNPSSSYIFAHFAFMIRLKIEMPIAMLGIDEIILFLYVFEYFFVIVSNLNSLNAN